MSLTALLRATKSSLQTLLSLTDTGVDIQPDPQPPPFLGEQFITVHPISWGIGDTNEVMYGLDEVFGIGVTVTQKTGKVPRQKWGTNTYTLTTTGLEAICNRIKVNIHQNYTLLTAANALLTGGDIFIEPLRFQGADSEPQPRTGEWLWSDDPGTMESILALSVTLRFGGARRMQAVGNIA
jgi:hypothetical protein